MEYRLLACYQYVEIPEPERVRDELRAHCERLGILGRILVGKEGLNCAVSGTLESITLFKTVLRAYSYFKKTPFKERPCERNAYHKLVVRVRPEIVVFGEDVDLRHRGTSLSPQQLDQWYAKKEDMVIIDARNDYEAAVGVFEGAVTLPIHTFKEFSKVLKKLEPYKNKKIVTYCTGGIRCEKASAYLKEHGFTEVYQLDGGIVNYLNQSKAGHFKGNCFMFDDRLGDSAGEPLTSCATCGNLNDRYVNCHNLDCDKLFIQCETCSEKTKTMCTKTCEQAPRQRKPLARPREEAGIVENYYPKAKAALVQLKHPATQGMKLFIEGKTTPRFDFILPELRTAQGIPCKKAETGDLVTFVIPQKVRRHDTLYLEH